MNQLKSQNQFKPFELTEIEESGKSKSLGEKAQDIIQLLNLCRCSSCEKATLFVTIVNGKVSLLMHLRVQTINVLQIKFDFK